MTLEDDLKGKALALISQQMANWVVEIQRQIGEHQGNLVRALDEMQESVARYDERIDERDIERGMREVLATQPPAVASGPGMDQLKAAVTQIDKGASLSEVLTYLVDEVARNTDRAAMFIVKGTNAIGWYAKGTDTPDAVKQINIPLTADTVLRNVHNGKKAMRGHISQTPGTAQALARLGGRPQGLLAVPLVLRDKLAAILYCDVASEEIPAGVADMVEVLVHVAGKTIDILSLAPKTAPNAARTTSGNTAERAAAIRAGGDDVRERAGLAPAPAARPRTAPPPPAGPAEEGSSTVMFSSAQVAQARQAAPSGVPAAPVVVRPEDQKAHDDAKRFARLVVSEIKLYNEAKVNEGRRSRDLYERLKEDIERGRQMYNERVPAQVRDQTNYFFDELVRILAGGDSAALGAM
jgi:ribonuclease HI